MEMSSLFFFRNTVAVSVRDRLGRRRCQLGAMNQHCSCQAANVNVTHSCCAVQQPTSCCTFQRPTSCCTFQRPTSCCHQRVCCQPTPNVVYVPVPVYLPPGSMMPRMQSYLTQMPMFDSYASAMMTYGQLHPQHFAGRFRQPSPRSAMYDYFQSQWQRPMHPGSVIEAGGLEYGVASDVDNDMAVRSTQSSAVDRQTSFANSDSSLLCNNDGSANFGVSEKSETAFSGMTTSRSSSTAANTNNSQQESNLLMDCLIADLESGLNKMQFKDEKKELQQQQQNEEEEEEDEDEADDVNYFRLQLETETKISVHSSQQQQSEMNVLAAGSVTSDVNPSSTKNAVDVVKNHRGAFTKVAVAKQSPVDVMVGEYNSAVDFLWNNQLPADFGPADPSLLAAVNLDFDWSSGFDLQPASKTRAVIIDGSNVAMSLHKDNRTYSVAAIVKAVSYFLKRRHPVLVLLSRSFYDNCSQYTVVNRDLFPVLIMRGLLTMTPVIDWSVGNQRKKFVAYEDYFIAEQAYLTAGLIVTCDNFHDVFEQMPAWRSALQNSMVNFSWDDDYNFCVRARNEQLNVQHMLNYGNEEKVKVVMQPLDDYEIDEVLSIFKSLLPL